jgi:uncharacterized membrane protein YecN with MAPEG domain
VRKLELTAVRAFLKLGRRQRMMAAAHVPLGRRSFSLGDSHCGTFEINKNCDDLRLISRENPTGGGRIVANRRPYSGWSRCCKGGHRMQGRGGEATMTPIPITLLTGGALVAVNFWLGARISAYRRDFKVSVGDGGIENAPFVLILLASLELSGAYRWGLVALSVIFVLARISHGIGMDAPELRRWRAIGMISTALALAAIAIWAIVAGVGALLGR